MRWQNRSHVEASLSEAVNGRLCVQVWLGIGNTLFVGFGDGLLPPVAPGELHPVPAYELQTGNADWRLERGSSVIGTSTDDRETAQQAVSVLTGCRASGWSFSESIADLNIEFEGDVRLLIHPYPDCAGTDEDAWILRMPGKYYGYVTCTGEIGNGRRDAVPWSVKGD